MTAAQLQTLLDDSSCSQCYVGLSVPQLIKLALLDRVSQLYPAYSFIQRAGITDATQIAAINQLVLSAKEHGWWDKCDLIYPFVGGTAGAHAQNLKSANFTITWNGAVTHNANGITGDGATGYGNTNYVPSVHHQQFALNSCHLGVYIRIKGSAINMSYAGASSPRNIEMYTSNPATGTSIFCNDNNVKIFTLTSLGLQVANRSSATEKVLFDSTLRALQTSGPAQFAVYPLAVLATNQIGIFTKISDCNLAGATLGAKMTYPEYQLMSTDWQAFQTALGRQV